MLILAENLSDSLKLRTFSNYRRLQNSKHTVVSLSIVAQLEGEHMKKLIKVIEFVKKPNKLYYIANATEERAKEFNLEYNPEHCYIVEVNINRVGDK